MTPNTLALTAQPAGSLRLGGLLLGAALILAPLAADAQTTPPAGDAAGATASEPATAGGDATAATGAEAPAEGGTPAAAAGAEATSADATAGSAATPGEASAAPAGEETLQAAAVLRGPDGTEHGSVTVADTPSGALHVIVNLSSLPEGPHAIHIHETGLCEPPTFESAGGHLSGGKEHGALSEGGMHLGDLPNINSPEGGEVNQEFFLPGVTLADVMDDDGGAFVVHAGPDDYTSQPSGNSGDRIACGVFAASKS